MVEIKAIHAFSDNYIWLLSTNEGSVVIDPGDFSPVSEYIKNHDKDLVGVLITHHHFDHVGGNEELKKKYNAIVVGYKHDSERIPEIDILLEDNEIWERDNFVAKIIHVPGHTKGHICFNFYKEKLLFTGDTLFSLGCGKIFEGTYEQMFNSLKKIKALPLDTKIFCGHEYTLNNSKFCIKYDNENLSLQKKIQDIEIKLNDSLPTIPSTLKEEIDCNIFLRAKDLKTFSKLRDLKDNF